MKQETPKQVEETKRQYARPQLIKHGSVEVLTQISISQAQP